MSIQNRLLVIYTAIFMVAFIMFATIVYILPLSQIRAQVDADLATLAAELQGGNIVQTEEGAFSITIPETLNTIQTASSFFLFVDREGTILLRSGNWKPELGYLDANGFRSREYYSQVILGDASLRVLTVPIFAPQAPDSRPVAYVQVGRLFDSIESFTRFLLIALFVGFAGATASLFLGILLTPSSFKPLEDMADVARQITNADDLSRRVPYTERTDEVGVLARAFNQLLERLERLFQTQQRLLADVSHELRTPLTAIRGNVDLMRRMGEADDESLQIIQEESERMTRLVGDLLLLARADAGGLPLERKILELDTIFFEVYRQVRLLELAVTVTVKEVDSVLVLGDPDRIKQLWWNLVGNAIKYTPPDGSVTLSLCKKGGMACLQVTDTGVGIPAQDLPYIFDRFFRVDKARNRQQGGSGLGLSIAKWIAEAHDGRIEVESEMGVGTTFTVVLPLLPQSYYDDTAVMDDDEESTASTRPSLRALGSPFRR